MNHLRMRSTIKLAAVLLLCMMMLNQAVFVARGFSEFEFFSFTDEQCRAALSTGNSSASCGSTAFSSDTLELTPKEYAGFGSIHNSSAAGSYTVGRVLYSLGIQMLDRVDRTALSFSTEFTFSMINNPNSSQTIGADGFAFIMVSDASFVGSPGQYFGIFNESSTTNDSNFGTQTPAVFAVEFDTFQNLESGDINSNHVGVDVQNSTSLKSERAEEVGIQLNSGEKISVWIDYDSYSDQNNSHLMVRIADESSSTTEPSQVLLSVYGLNLTAVMRDTMWVGFSATTAKDSNGAYAQYHTIHSWSFRTRNSSNSSQMDHSNSSSNDDLGRASGGAPISNPADNRPFEIPVKLLALLSFSSFVLTVCICCFGYCLCRSYHQRKGSGLLGQTLNMRHMVAVDGPHEYKYKELSAATEGFDEKYLLGGGGFGNVFKGVLSRTDAEGCVRTTTVAVKRMLHGHIQGEKEFMKEVSVISRLRHRNLVQLLGWCGDRKRSEFLLVYEYMPRGSLDKNLFVPSIMSGKKKYTVSVLSWPQRFKIVRGIAAALHYLHEGCSGKVIHRDVKASNVMLDDEFNAKLGDFGLARLMSDNYADLDSQACSAQPAGTWGYMAPETAKLGTFTEKSDTFAFGAVILEVACGRLALDQSQPGEDSVLVDYVWRIVAKDGNLLKAADKRLHGNFNEQEIELVLVVGLLCSHPDPLERPSMRQVVQFLAGEAVPPPIPAMKPAASYKPLSDFDFESFHKQNYCPPWSSDSPSSTEVSSGHAHYIRSRAELELMIVR